MNSFNDLLSDALEHNTFISCTWSNPRKKESPKKIIAKGVQLQDTFYIQFTTYKENKAFHENVEPQNILNFTQENCLGFKQIQLFTTAHDYTVLVNKKEETHIKKCAASQKMPTSLSHNRQKKYILDTPSSTSFLKALNLMDTSGAIKPSKYDKYKQINRYLEIVADTLEALPDGPLRIIDFGCGKSYLTFALYHYLHNLLNKQVEVVGLDLKKDVIAFCNDLAKNLDFTGLKFQVGDIGQYTTDKPIDMVVSLHACNTATDSALHKAIGWGAKVILAVPCCHHEAYTQIQNNLLEPVLKYGILKERIAALMTDGLRANLLESMGYNVSVIEFIDMTHTPKNILIRALLKEKVTFNKKVYDDYESLCQALHLDLSLDRSLDLSSKINN